MRFFIDNKNSGKTVRDFLRLQGVSATLLARLKRREDGILQNGKRVTVRAVLSSGDVLTLAVEDAAPSEKLLPLAVPVEVLLETEDYLAVNKPPFMPTHPSHGHFTDTLANALVYRYGEAPFRPRFVNRLDRNTSGIVLVAKNAYRAAGLSRAMAEGKMEKDYIAVVCGKISAETVLKTGIRRRQESIIFREVCATDEGELAITEVFPLCTAGGYTLVRLLPKTGRTHQLRVQLSSIGAPILGDTLYGTASALIGRHALHAQRLSFPATEGEGNISVFAPVPADMRAVILEIFGEEGIRLAEQ